MLWRERGRMPRWRHHAATVLPTIEARLLHSAEFPEHRDARMRPHVGAEATGLALPERRTRRCLSLFVQAVLASAALSLATTALTATWAADKAAATLGADDREALGRVAYAEAGDQREEGLAAVAHAVLNRVASGQFGASVQGVLDAPGQFEPVTRAGGSWRYLPPLTASQRLVFGTILDLILQGRLPDPTAGSTYFQNAAVVAQRAAAGQVPPNLVNFGGQTPAATVRDHSFFHGDRTGSAARRSSPPASGSTPGLYRPVGASPAPQGPEALPAPRAKLIRVGAPHGGPRTRVRILYGTTPD